MGAGAGGDVEVEQQPGGEQPQREDGVHLVTVDVAVHDAEHHTILPRLQQPRDQLGPRTHSGPRAGNEPSFRVPREGPY